MTAESKQPPPPPATPAGGLSAAEATSRLAAWGPNSLPDTRPGVLWRVLSQFSAPVPWLLEAALVLEICLGKYVEGSILLALLTFNALLGFVQEGRAQATLVALRSRLALSASVLRDGKWRVVPAAQVVPGDRVKLSLGGRVPADVTLTGGEVLIDQSMLTGESIPIDAGPGVLTFSGALVRRGEAEALVTATGSRSKFGRSAELVRTASVESTQQKAVFRVVRNLAICNGAITVALAFYAHHLGRPPSEIITLVLTAVLASVPVALPATFTLAAAVGARDLGRVGVLPTRLSAVDEAASIDVLCADKTGTLTCNELSVTQTRPMQGFDEAHVLGFASLASSEGGQDTVDAAVRSAALLHPAAGLPALLHFSHFDPATKMSQATLSPGGGAELAVKGAFDVVSRLCQACPEASGVAAQMEASGMRVLAVAAGAPGNLRLAGVIGLSDPPRADSSALVAELGTLGVRTVMITGDAPETALIAAREVGLEGPACPPGAVPPDARPEQYSVYAGVLPEGKFALVKAFQRSGHTVGMCGDGANDAPALRQAHMGIAVATATDVAKAAAGIVLTKPGLGGIVASVKEGRITFQRILTYTLNSVTKKIVQVLFLAAGLVLTGHAILTPMLMVIVMLTGDLLGMSLTTDNVRPSPKPNAWHVGGLTLAGAFMGFCELGYCLAVLLVARGRLGPAIEPLRTFAFLAIVFGNQATTYCNRVRLGLWTSPPSGWLVASSVADVAIASALALWGVAMAPVPPLWIACMLAGAAAFAVLLDLAKVPVLRRLRLS